MGGYRVVEGAECRSVLVDLAFEPPLLQIQRKGLHRTPGITPARRSSNSQLEVLEHHSRHQSSVIAVIVVMLGWNNSGARTKPRSSAAESPSISA